MVQNITAQCVTVDLYAIAKITRLKWFISVVNAITIISTWFLSISIITHYQRLQTVGVEKRNEKDTQQ